MAAPRETLASTPFRSAKWISGGTLLAALLVTIFYGDVPLKHRAYFLIGLSTVAIIQGIALRNMEQDALHGRAFQMNVNALAFTVFAMILHIGAFALKAPISFFAFAAEAVLFGLACRALYNANAYK